MNSPYQPPASRPAFGGATVPSARSRLWFGFGLGWAGLAVTFLWTIFLTPFAGRVVSNGVLGVLLMFVVLAAPTLALLAYFGIRREWRAVFGVLLALASAVVFMTLLTVVFMGILGAGRFPD